MIGHNEKIERTLEPCPNTVAGRNHLALGEAIRFIWTEPISHHAGIG